MKHLRRALLRRAKFVAISALAISLLAEGTLAEGKIVQPNNRLPAGVRDHGQIGKVFEIIEVDFVKYMRRHAHKNIDLKKLFLDAIERMRGTALPIAKETKESFHTPEYVLEFDVKDHHGNILRAQGTKINILDGRQIECDFLFINGDRKCERDFAKRLSDTAVVLTSGKPKENEFFDQGGILVKRFSVKATPTLVTQVGNQLRLQEVGL